MVKRDDITFFPLNEMWTRVLPICVQRGQGHHVWWGGGGLGEKRMEQELAEAERSAEAGDRRAGPLLKL